MKNTKSKIVIPALGLILLSTAASISGSVAWFTAQRTAYISAGDFAVVNTKGNLQYELGAGLGTTLGVNEGDYSVKTIAGKTLTDASFDHITSDHFIFAPDVSGTKVGKKVGLEDATFDNDENTGIQRDNEDIYSAFTWDITFKLSVPSSATNDIGLFFSANEAKMAKVVTLPAATVIAANEYYYSDVDCKTRVTGTLAEEKTLYAPEHIAVDFAANAAIPADTYYSDAACTSAYAGRGETGDAMTVYAKNGVEFDTGIGFRIAFVGTTETYTTTRVWSDLQSSDNAKHVLAAAAVNDELAASGKTASYVSPALIDKALDADPETLTGVRTNYTNSPLYLGHFAKAQAGSTVELSFTCVAWFEGTDPHIVNNPDTVYEVMASYLAFETIDLPNA